MRLFRRVPLIFIFSLWAIPFISLAQQDSLSASPSPYIDQNYPTQQFVTAEPEEPPAQVSAENSTAANANSIAPRPVVPTQNQTAPADSATDKDPNPAISGVRTPNPNTPPLGDLYYTPPPPAAPTPTIVNPQPHGEPPKIGLQFYGPTPNHPVEQPTPNPRIGQYQIPAPNPIELQQPTPNPSTPNNPAGLPSDEELFAPSKPIAMFQGGLDDRSFVQCQRIASGTCSMTTDNAKFTHCLTQIARQPVCQQFAIFAGLSRLGPMDDMDVFQKYNEANLTLIHLTRGVSVKASNYSPYPGDYFVIGNNGSFVDINAGKEAQALDVTKDPNYPSIAMQYRQVQLFSMIDKPPRIEPSMQGSGIRMIFSYQLRNGCATCDLIGYADVAFDFSDDGSLKKTSVLGLRTLK